MGCSQWSRKELDTTERLHFHFSLSCIGEGNGNPLLCSCMENPRDGRAWWATVHGVAQSWTRLKWLSSSSSRSRALVWSWMEVKFSVLEMESERLTDELDTRCKERKQRFFSWSKWVYACEFIAIVQNKQVGGDCNKNCVLSVLIVRCLPSQIESSSKWTRRSYCIAQGSIINILWWTIKENNMKKNTYMY